MAMKLERARARTPGRPRSAGEVAAAIPALWGDNGGVLELVSIATEPVFRWISPGLTTYLRLSSIHRRTAGEVFAELQFVEYLDAKGLRVAAPVRSTSGALFERIGPWHAAVFREAPGSRYRYASTGEDCAEFFDRGRYLARLHELSRGFAPGAHGRRFQWSRDPLWEKAHAYVSPRITAFWRECETVMRWALSLSRDPHQYGLIHGDFGGTNYHRDQIGITAFDFDDCCYHWFAYDLAVTLYPHALRSDGAAFVEALLRGYQSISAGSAPDLHTLWMFCRMRAVYMYLLHASAWVHASPPSSMREWFDAAERRMEAPVNWLSGAML